MFNSTNADDKPGSPVRVTWRKVAAYLDTEQPITSLVWWMLAAFLLGASLTMAALITHEVMASR